MAKKSGPNKSQAIREFHAANPEIKPMQISAELKKQGVDVTPAFISTVLSTDKRKSKKTGKRGSVKRKTASNKTAAPRATKPTTTSSTGEVSLDSLLKVKKIVEEMGSFEDAKNALTALQKLSD